MPDFWALKFATWVASLHSLNWCKTGLLSTKPVAFASEPIRDQPADFQTVAQSHPYTVILQVTKSGLDVVTMNNDWCHMKVGCLVNICMLKVSCRFDLIPLLELQIHGGIRHCSWASDFCRASWFPTCVIGGKVDFEGLPLEFRLPVQRRKEVLGVGLVNDALWGNIVLEHWHSTSASLAISNKTHTSS